MGRPKYIPLLVAITLLIAGLVLSHIPRGVTRRQYAHLSLSVMLPGVAGQWVGKDQPLAEGDAAMQQVLRVLNFDDSIYRVYRSGSDEIGIYAAYWRRGKMSVRDIESHVPDICWKVAGWELRERRHGYSLSSTPGVTDVHCEYRFFISHGQGVHVVYWHVLEGEVIQNYGVIDVVPWWAPLRDMLQFGFNISGEQYFVRIHSNRDLRELQRDPAVAALFAAIVRLPVANGLPHETR